MSSPAAYDEIADWYENEFLAKQRSATIGTGFADTLGIDQAVVELLGPGHGLCLDVGCGTGIYAERVRQLGWHPVGIDISAGMLRHARQRLPVTRGDAERLPFANNSFDSAVAVMAHTDVPDYDKVLPEIHRVLKPGGRFVHIGVHPCFCGGFAIAPTSTPSSSDPAIWAVNGPPSRGPTKGCETRSAPHTSRWPTC